MENIKLYANLERVMAHQDDTEGALGDAAFEILGRARTKLAAHTKTGEHRITQTKGKLDHYVNLEGEAPLSVEEGHHAKDGTWVEGLHVLRESILP